MISKSRQNDHTRGVRGRIEGREMEAGVIAATGRYSCIYDAFRSDIPKNRWIKDLMIAAPCSDIELIACRFSYLLRQDIFYWQPYRVKYIAPCIEIDRICPADRSLF